MLQLKRSDECMYSLSYVDGFVLAVSKNKTAACAEVYQRMLPATTESGPAYTETVTTSGVGSAVWMDIGSMHAQIDPRSAPTPYTTTCSAFLGETMMDLDCAATITQQIWSTSGANTAPYRSGRRAHAVGSIRPDRPGLG